MTKNKQLIINSLGGCRIRVERVNNQEYFCLTDLASYSKLPRRKVIERWISRKKTIEFLTQWERQHNPKFHEAELGKGLSAKKWITRTNATGIFTRQGAQSTWGHLDIATHFMGSLSVEFQVHVIKELHRLRKQEQAGNRLEPQWATWRQLTKNFYRVQTDAVQKYLTKGDTVNNPQFVYASEADLLNKIIFGMTAREFRAKNPKLGKKENIRDFANIHELGLLVALEAANGEYIAEGQSQSVRFQRLEARKAQLLPSLNPEKKLK